MMKGFKSNVYPWAVPKGVTRACEVELQEIGRLVYVLGLGKAKTNSEPSAVVRTC